MQSETNTMTAPGYIWNAYDDVRRRNAARLAALHAQDINSTTLRQWSTHSEVRQRAIIEALKPEMTVA